MSRSHPAFDRWKETCPVGETLESILCRRYTPRPWKEDFKPIVDNSENDYTKEHTKSTATRFRKAERTQQICPISVNEEDLVLPGKTIPPPVPSRERLTDEQKKQKTKRPHGEVSGE